MGMYRSLLTGVVEALVYARADDWVDILAFTPKAIKWTDADEAELDRALRRYEEKGADHERGDCTDLDELTGLRESWTKLHSNYGLALKPEIDRLEEEIAEREAGTPELEEVIGYSRDRTPLPLDLITDDQVREMFRTLGEDI